MPSPRQVVITGLGVVSPLGVGCEVFWEALVAARSGIDWLPEAEGAALPFRFGGRVKDLDAKQFIQPRKTIKVMCREIQSAYAAAVLAMQHAGLAKGAVEPDRLGVVLGSELLYGELDELVEVYRHCATAGEGANSQFNASRWGEYAFKDLFPLWMLKYLPNMAACHISIALDARGPNNSIVAGGASSLLALMEAVQIIERGLADVMLVGGSGSLTSFSSLPFRGWRQLSRWTGEPKRASRPFDALRSGLVPGEGAGALIIEDREHAERRGAAGLARVAGFASRYEPPGDVWQARSGQAIRQSIEAALAAARLEPQRIGHVNAHGDSTLAGDQSEAEAIRQTLGDVPVIALKSAFGDLGAGSGAVELIASVLALQHGRLPPTLNYDQADPACPINVVHGEARPAGPLTALALNQSSTGQAAAVAIVREE